MRYHSSRSKSLEASASQAILEGIAPDGGLYVPQSLPIVDFAAWQGDSYLEIAEKIFSLFLTDFDPERIRGLLAKSYGANFQDPRITPVHRLDERTGVLELWHGPSLAFKDLALQVLPRLFLEAKKIRGVEDRFLILTATSGDTGKAAMAGFAGVPDSYVAVFYPDGGVSRMQERQMLTPSQANVAAFALEGNFDDCQREVKALMQDPTLADRLALEGIRLSSANSINIGRLIPQMVYYIAAYFQAVPSFGLPLSVVVPSGNVGNILAARYVKAMGLPLADIQLASNRNRVLFDFLTTGHYQARRPLYRTSSPSMDILVASNLERYLYLLTGDEKLVGGLMADLKETGHFYYDPSLLDLTASWADEDQVMSSIREVFDHYGYLMDPHTGVAASGTFERDLPGYRLIVSTASPYKFPDSVLKALAREIPQDLLDQLARVREILGGPLPPAVKVLMEKEPLEKTRLSTGEIRPALEGLVRRPQ